MTPRDLLDAVSITAVWTALGGASPVRGRAPAFWRETRDRNVAIREPKGTWYDHRDGVGGGVLDLVTHIRGGDHGDALRWLSETFCLPLDGRELTPEQKRDYARRRRAARDLARQTLIWYDERLIQLDDAKARANEDGDVDALVWAAHEHHRLHTLTEDDVLREYLHHRQEHPDECAGLIRAGTTWANACRAAVDAVIRQIAADQRGEATDAA